jgi:hypothetical protein
VAAATPPVKGAAEKEWILQDIAGATKKRFTGMHLAYSSSGAKKSLPRWLTLDLYRKSDGTYMLHRIGYSVVYHDIDGCEGGELVTYPQLLDQLGDGEAGEPCPDCRPASFQAVKEELARNPKTLECVLLERVLYKVIDVPDVPSLVREMEYVPRNSRTGKRIISRPGQELLLRAADHDETIKALLDVIEDV